MGFQQREAKTSANLTCRSRASKLGDHLTGYLQFHNTRCYFDSCGWKRELVLSAILRAQSTRSVGAEKQSYAFADYPDFFGTLPPPVSLQPDDIRHLRPRIDTRQGAHSHLFRRADIDILYSILLRLGSRRESVEFVIVWTGVQMSFCNQGQSANVDGSMQAVLPELWILWIAQVSSSKNLLQMRSDVSEHSYTQVLDNRLDLLFHEVIIVQDVHDI